MQPVSIIGLFCEDIRLEKTDIVTIVGVIPDNANVLQLPAVMPKLCVYVRVHFDPNDDRVKSVRHVLTLLDGSENPIGDGNEALIVRAKAEAKANGNPLAAIFSRAEISPFIINEHGRILVHTEIGRKKYVACTLNFIPPSP